ncbi:MAG: hypothetical protein AB7L28_18620, partial [Kofleriaceae bacterium]
AAVVLVASTAAADPVADERRGMALYQAESYAEAAVALEAAYVETRSLRVGFALAQALRLAGDCPRALIFYREVLDRAPLATRPKLDEAMAPCVEAEAAAARFEAARAEAARAEAARAEAARAEAARAEEARAQAAQAEAARAQAARAEAARADAVRVQAVRTDRTPQHRAPWLLAGAGVGALAGAMFHVLAYRERGILDEARLDHDPDRYRAHKGTFSAFRGITIGLYGASAVALTIGAIMWRRERAAPRISGVVGSQGAVVLVEWQR